MARVPSIRRWRRSVFVLLLAVLTFSGVVAHRPAGTLDIYWIDVEGGAATLIVTPAGESVLMDAGWSGFGDRDAARIERVLRNEAGLARLDYLLISHYHGDHFGGLAALAARVDIRNFIDHGDVVENSARPAWEQYVALAGARRRVAQVGDRLPLEGVELTIVAAHSRALSAAPDAAPNALCATFTAQAEDRSENGKSLGYVLRAGNFDFVDLGDLSWNYQHALACPVNVLGSIDLYQVTHHGTRDDVLPQLIGALAPTVAVMNNGPIKGAGPVAVETVLRSPALQDLWSLHRAVNNDAAHNAAEQLTANLGATDGCEGAWIRARVDTDGTYTLLNSRNLHTRTYRVK